MITSKPTSGQDLGPRSVPARPACPGHSGNVFAAWHGVASPVLGILAIGFSGCTMPAEYIANGFKVGHNYQRPPARSLHTGSTRMTRASQCGRDDSHWWTVFNDPKLNELQIAYQQNLSVREAASRLAKPCLVSGRHRQRLPANADHERQL